MSSWRRIRSWCRSTLSWSRSSGRSILCGRSRRSRIPTSARPPSSRRGRGNDWRAGRRSPPATLDQQATALGTQTSRVAQGVRELPTVEAQEVRLVQQVETIKNLGNQLREERQRAAMAEAIAVGEVEIVDAARPPYT